MGLAFDEQKALADMSAVVNEPMTLEILGGELIVLIATIQLACRHPAWAGNSREVVERLARNWQNIVADPGSAMWGALDAGWDAAYDTTIASVSRGQVVDRETGRQLGSVPVDVQIMRANVDMVRGLTKALLAMLNRWIGQHGPVNYVDVFMAAHNLHTHVVFDLEKRTGDDRGYLRKMAIDTMRERFEREPGPGSDPGNKQIEE